VSTQTYTYRDLAHALGVSETTIKSYRTKFPTFFPVAREGKPLHLHAEALDVCRRIRELFAQGLSISQTHSALSAEYKEYPKNRRLSTSQKSGACALAEAPVSAGFDAHITAIAQAQLQAEARLERLEAEVRNLATLEAASKSLVAELLAELRAQNRYAALAAAPAPPAADAEPHAPPSPPTPAQDEPPTQLTARKIVTLHGAGGPVASYAFSREAKPPSPFPDPDAPDAAFLALPAVIRSDRGDFLGLPGGQTVRRVVEVLAPEGSHEVAWMLEEHGWSCFIPLGRAQRREIFFERTTTPRGNQVGLIRRMRINEAEATPVQLQEIFRQLRDQLSPPQHQKDM
jgi:DNA-binding transcriptional MerR regulator